MARTHKRNGMTAAALFAVTGGMVGLAFASVPLYQLFCQVTGYGGTPKIGAIASEAVVSDRVIKIRFDANTNGELPWVFKPKQRQVTVKLGESRLAFYTAKNMGERAVTGTATYNVAPYKAAKYFSKIDCFCFSEQTLAPGEELPMPVEFIVDPEIFNDPNTRELRTITLSYTFFPTTAGEPPVDDKTSNARVHRTTKEAAQNPSPNSS